MLGLRRVKRARSGKGCSSPSIAERWPSKLLGSTTHLIVQRFEELGTLFPITNHPTSARHLTTAGHSHSEFEYLVTASLSLNDRNMINRSFNRNFGVASVHLC